MSTTLDLKVALQYSACEHAVRLPALHTPQPPSLTCWGVGDDTGMGVGGSRLLLSSHLFVRTRRLLLRVAVQGPEAGWQSTVGGVSAQELSGLHELVTLVPVG